MTWIKENVLFALIVLIVTMALVFGAHPKKDVISGETSQTVVQEQQ